MGLLSSERDLNSVHLEVEFLHPDCRFPQPYKKYICTMTETSAAN